MHLGFKHRKLFTLTIVLLSMILQVNVYAQKSTSTDSLTIAPRDTIQSIASFEEKPILYMQQKLNMLGFQVPENNILDEQTKKAFTNFLKTYGFPVPIMKHDHIKELFDIAIREYKN